MYKGYDIIADPDFGFFRLDPIPSQEEVDKFYAEEFYSLYNTYFNDSSLAVQQEEKDFFDGRWEDIYNVCARYFSDLTGKSVFDVGFGFAQALIYLKAKGLKVAGLEPSKEAVEYGLHNGIEAYNSGIESFDIVGEKRFDIVLLMNVLEHLRNPAETLLNIKSKLLKSDGLLIIDVPNEFNDFQTIANSEYKLNEWWVVPPNHINYFSATTLKNLLEKCGYNVWYIQASFPLELFMLLGDVYVGNPVVGKDCHNKRVKFESLMRKHGKQEKLAQLYKNLAELDLGRQVTIYATVKK